MTWISFLGCMTIFLCFYVEWMTCHFVATRLALASWVCVVTFLFLVLFDRWLLCEFAIVYCFPSFVRAFSPAFFGWARDSSDSSMSSFFFPSGVCSISSKVFVISVMLLAVFSVLNDFSLNFLASVNFTSFFGYGDSFCFHLCALLFWLFLLILGSLGGEVVCFFSFYVCDVWLLVFLLFSSICYCSNWIFFLKMS